MEVSGGYKLQPGERAPDFDLPSVEGKNVSLAKLPKSEALVVAFWCNHCPYVRAYEQRFIDWSREAMAKGVQVVAICSNDEVNYPDDSLPHMVERAREMKYPFAYLRDIDQKVATAYGGQCTPHFLVFDRERRLVYQGRFDDNKDDPRAVRERHLPDVVDALLAGKTPAKSQTWAIGCSIKWST